MSEHDIVRFSIWKGLFAGRVSSPDLPELSTTDNDLDRRSAAISVRRQLAEHFCEQWPVGKPDGAAQRVAQQLATKLLYKIVTSSGRQVFPKTLDPLDGCAVDEPGPGVRRACPQPPDGIVPFQGKPEWINSRMALGAPRYGVVPLH